VPIRDSDKRQREAIEAFAKRAGYEIVAEFYDAAVSGADAIEARPGFLALLKLSRLSAATPNSRKRRSSPS
jgi:DNA invertase Pin-like site-specific DNA recombinase